MNGQTGVDRCSACGEPVPEAARFCPSCGARLSEQQAPTPDPRTRPTEEHRQITVMVSDLVDSTRLAAILHSEDLREVLRAYQTICGEEIDARGGMVANYMGDGILAYFGFPVALEDAPARAAAAALAIVNRVADGDEMPPVATGKVAARIALHTGRVLVSEMGMGEARHRHAITGMVPNVAARLEGLAAPNSVVVSDTTCALIERAFELESMGRHDLKGIDGAMEAYRLVRAREGTSLVGSAQRGIVGRQKEIARLTRVWQAASAGRSGRASVIAEAGCGKSSLAAAFIGALGTTKDAVLQVTGQVDRRYSAYSAIRRTLEMTLAAVGADTDEAGHATILTWLGVAADEAAAAGHAEILVDLWRGKAAEGADGRAAIVDAVAALLIARPAPSLLVLEDAHWIDPSSLEVLDKTMGAGKARMTLVLSRREAAPAWSTPDDARIELDRLDSRACRQLVESVAACPVQAKLADEIEAATDGLPLYVEELTKSLMEEGRAVIRHGILRPAQLAASVDTPPSLLDLITARLDTLGEAKTHAQVASVLGRSFDVDALEVVSRTSSAAVDDAIAVLERAGIVLRRRRSVQFRHALFQKAAYESLVRRSRRRFHRRYVAWLRDDPVRMATVLPEHLGHHLAGCEEFADAARHYLDAGLAANKASASLEAAAHFERSQTLFARAPQDEEGRAVERLKAQVLLAGALLSARGPGAPETRDAYDVALTLAEQAPESDWHLAAYWGWWRVSDSFAMMAQRARRLVDVSQKMKGAEFKLQALHCAWANAFAMGDLAVSEITAEDGLDLYRSGHFEDQRTLYGGHDCMVCALGELGLTRWLMGAGDKAADLAAQALAHAEKIGHVGSLMHALDIAVMLAHYRRDQSSVAAIAGRLKALAEHHDLEEYRAKGDIFLGWCDIDEGRAESGLDRLDRGFRIMQEVGTPEDFPVYQSMRAQALRGLGDVDGALDALSRGRAVIVEQGVAYWAAEIAREEAAAELCRSAPDAAMVAARLAEARQIAERQGATALTLRAAATALHAAQRIGEGGFSKAHAELCTVLDRFPDTAKGRDLSDARDLLRTPGAA
ncbi:MAG: adenylate/guanylate cyclase domain-containing protein [Devosia sp.]